MDVVVQSLRTSALTKALQQSVDNDAWKPTIQKSDPASAKELISIELSDLKTSGGTMRVDIPKTGLISGCFLELTFEGISSGGLKGKHTVFPKVLAAEWLEEATFMSHSREICSVTGQTTLSLVDALPPTQRSLYLKLMGAEIGQNLVVTSAADDSLNIHKDLTGDEHGKVTVYLPIMLSPFMALGDHQKKQALWASFTESTQMRIKYKALAKLVIGNSVTASSTTTASTGATAIAGKMHFVCTTLDDMVYQRTIKDVYSAPSVQTLARKYHTIGEVEANIDSLAAGRLGSTHTFQLTTSASSLCRAIYVYVTRVEAVSGTEAGQLNNATNVRDAFIKAEAAVSAESDFEQILNVKMEGGGRTLFDCNSESALMLSAQDGFAASKDSLTNTFCYRFATDPNDGKYSGAASLSSISSQKFTVKAFIKRRAEAASTAANGDYKCKYRCRVVAESYQVVSVSSSDGSLKVALSV